MPSIAWPVEQMAAILGGSIRQQQDTYTIRWKSPALGIKLKLDVTPGEDRCRLVVDRISKQRPNFIGSLILDHVVGVELEPDQREVRICVASGLSLVVSADCTFQLYRPS